MGSDVIAMVFLEGFNRIPFGCKVVVSQLLRKLIWFLGCHLVAITDQVDARVSRGGTIQF